MPRPGLHRVPTLAALLLAACTHARDPHAAASSGAQADGIDAGHVSASPLLHEVDGPYCRLRCDPHQVCVVAIHAPGEAHAVVASTPEAPRDASIGALVLAAADGGVYEPEQIWFESGCVAIPAGCAADSCLCTARGRGGEPLRYCPPSTTVEPQCIVGPDGRPIQRCWAQDVTAAPAHGPSGS